MAYRRRLKVKKSEKNQGWLKAKWKTLTDWYYKDDNFLRIVRFPGTKLPLLDVLLDFFKLFTKGRTIDRAAGVAFNFFVALFPLLLFGFTLIPYIPIPHLYEWIMDALQTFLIPSGTLDYVTKTIDGIMKQPHDGLLSISIFLCLIFGSSGIVAIFNGFRNVYANYVSSKTLTLKGWLVQRLQAIFMLVVIGALMVVSVLLISLGGMGLKALVDNEIIAGGGFVLFLFNLLRWLVATSVLCLCVSLLYYFGNVQFGECYEKELKHPRPNGKRYRTFIIYSPGSLMTTALFVLGTVGFNVYISNFSRYNVLYGSIGTLIILMLWIWIVAILILAGNDLNSGIRRSSHRMSVHEYESESRQLVVEDLSKNIKKYEEENSCRQKRIEEVKKLLEDQGVLLAKLEKELFNRQLVIEAYRGFVEQELKQLPDQKEAPAPND